MALQEFRSAVIAVQNRIVPGWKIDENAPDSDPITSTGFSNASGAAIQLCKHLDALSECAEHLGDIPPDLHSSHDKLIKHFGGLLEDLKYIDRQDKKDIKAAVYQLCSDLMQLEQYSDEKGQALAHRVDALAKKNIQPFLGPMGERERRIGGGIGAALGVGVTAGAFGVASLLHPAQEAQPPFKAVSSAAKERAEGQEKESYAARIASARESVKKIVGEPVLPKAVAVPANASAPVITYTEEGPRAKENEMPYCVYYGDGPLNELARVKTLVVEPHRYTKEDIQSFMKLPNHPETLVGYLSVGGVNLTDPRLPEMEKLGIKLEQKGSYYGLQPDIEDPKWRDYMKSRIEEQAAKGFQAIAFDTTDLSEPDKMIPFVKELAAHCKKHHMGCEIIGGYTSAGDVRVEKMLDDKDLPHRAVIAESVFTEYKTGEGKWGMRSQGDTDWTLGRLKNFITSGGDVNIVSFISPEMPEDVIKSIAEREHYVRDKVKEWGPGCGKVTHYVSKNSHRWDQKPEEAKPREPWEREYLEFQQVTPQTGLFPAVSTHDERMERAPELKEQLAEKPIVNYQGKQMSVILNNAVVLSENAGDVVVLDDGIKTAADPFQNIVSNVIDITNPGKQPLTIALPFAGEIITDRGAVLRLDAMKPLRGGKVKENMSTAAIRLVGKEGRIPLELSAEQMANASMLMENGARAGIAIPFRDADNALAALVIKADGIKMDDFTVTFSDNEKRKYNVNLTDPDALQKLQQGFTAAGKLPPSLPREELKTLAEETLKAIYPDKKFEILPPGAKAQGQGRAR